MAKKLQLQIPEPCHENWDTMADRDHGRFCGSCQKTVVDFTGMSDAQLVAFFKKPSTGSVCGRFNDDQLHRDIAFPQKRLPWLKYMLQIFIPVFLTGMKSYSQGSVVLKTKKTPEVCVRPANEPVLITMGKPIAPATNKSITGRVVDTGGQGISFASVAIKGTRTGVTCDVDGLFQIGSVSFNTEQILEVSGVGFETAEKKIDKMIDGKVEIVLQEAASTVLSEVVVTTGLTKRRLVSCTTTGWLSATVGGVMVSKRTDSVATIFKRLFVTDSLKIYPNPAKSGSSIRIQLKNMEGSVQVELINILGQLINSSVVNNYEKNSLLSYQLPNTTPGTYILRITSKQTRQAQTEKFIIY